MSKIRSSIPTRPKPLGIFARTRNQENRFAAETQVLHNEVTQLLSRSQYAGKPGRNQLTNRLYLETLGVTPYPATVRDAYRTCLANIVDDEFERTHAWPQSIEELAPAELYELRANLRTQHAFLENEAAHCGTWLNDIKGTLSSLAAALPRQDKRPGFFTIEVPLIAMLSDPVSLIDTLVRSVTKFATEPGTPQLQLGQHLADLVVANLLHVSKLRRKDAEERPHNILWPAASKLQPVEIVQTYLARTPLEQLFNATIKIVIPDQFITEHSIITATTGHGKTQLMQAMILKAIGEDNVEA